MRIKQAFSVGLLALTPALTGCLVHTHSVLKTRARRTLSSVPSLDHLLDQVNERYAAVQSMTATSVTLNALHRGWRLRGLELNCYPTFSGYIVLGKPESIDFVLKVPVFGGDALHMVSDGKTFKMLIPHDDCAITGSDVVTNSAQKGLYSLRPDMILDSLLIHGLEDDQDVAMTQDSRTLPDPKTRKDVIEEPDYNLEFLSQSKGHVENTLRVIHIGRSTLLPYQQDIYNADGKVATQATYSNYQKFGDIIFPRRQSYVISRPLDELTLTITITKATFNQDLPGRIASSPW